MITQAIYNQLEMVIESKGLKLYDIETLKENDALLLRISIFKQEGVSLQDCETISTIISPLLDVELQSLDSYFLEVSSPGIERILKKPTHFLYSIGEKIEIKLNDKTTQRGVLKSYNNDEIEIIPLQMIQTKSKKMQKNEILCENDEQVEQISQFIALKDCKKIKTLFDWKSYGM